MATYSYFTIKDPSQGIYREKGSKFLSFAFPVRSEEDVKTMIAAVKKEYFDARHHCYAWILGAEKNQYRAFDDGEPNHSAGDPILGQIRSKNLTNVLVLVVRYFGGVKLGVGGLVSAYKTAAEDALTKAIIIEEEVTKTYTLAYDYSQTPDVMRLVKEFSLKVLHQEFNEECSMRIEIRCRDNDRFIEKTKLMQAMGSAVRLEE